MVRPLVWQVVGIDASGHGHGTCGHRHAGQYDAESCPWTPDPWPEVCDLLVRQVRDPMYTTPRAELDQRRAAARMPQQLELAI